MLSTHVLDTALGKPASGIAVTLERDGEVLARAVTDADGRVPEFHPASALQLGAYRLVFQVRDYFAARKTDSFYSEIVVQFTIEDPADRYHIPLLLSPHGYSTYRGS